MSFRRSHLKYLFKKVISKLFSYVEIDTQIFIHHYFTKRNDYKLLNDKRVIGVKVDNFQDTIKYIVSNF